MLTHLSHEGLKSPRTLEKLNTEIKNRIHSECSDVRWVSSYAVLGPADYVDIFTAPNIESAMKVATIVRTYGHATTEVWGAEPWEGFLRMAKELPPAEFILDA